MLISRVFLFLFLLLFFLCGFLYFVTQVIKAVKLLFAEMYFIKHGIASGV